MSRQYRKGAEMPTYYTVRVFDEDTLAQRYGRALCTTDQTEAWDYYQTIRDLDGCVVSYEIHEESETA